MSTPDQSPHRSGFVALVGRPNAGKTTLTNALVGEKVGIVSNRRRPPGTPSAACVHRPAGQIVLVDTPGLHKPRSLLGQRLNDVVRDTLSDVDVVVFCVPADQPVGTGDKFIARQLREVNAPVVAVVTKTDAACKKAIALQLLAASQLVDAAEVVPVSAVRGDQVELLADLLIGMLPEGPALYPEEQTTDEDTERQIAELIREAALEKVRQEVPHSLAVTIEEIVRRPDPSVPMANWSRCTRCCTSSGPARSRCFSGGRQHIKAIGSEARAGMEMLLGSRVHLDLHVTVLGEWQDDPRSSTGWATERAMSGTPKALYRDEGVVLRTQKLGEADRIITVLTRRHGKVRAVAKGVRRTKSKFGARLEPFSHVDLQFYTGRNLDIVSRPSRSAPTARRWRRLSAPTPPAPRCSRPPTG